MNTIIITNKKDSKTEKRMKKKIHPYMYTHSYCKIPEIKELTIQ